MMILLEALECFFNHATTVRRTPYLAAVDRRLGGSNKCRPFPFIAFTLSF